jgi:hypothetical protein
MPTCMRHRKSAADWTTFRWSRQVERLWRASAGSAHSKMWPSIELRVTIEVGGRPYAFPDEPAMSAAFPASKRARSKALSTRGPPACPVRDSNRFSKGRLFQ